MPIEPITTIKEPTIIKEPTTIARPRKRFSLTWRMIEMLLLCWVLPVMLVVLVWGSYLHGTLKDQSIERLTLSLAGATQLTTMRMDAAVAASREISYIGTVRDAWSSYQTDSNKMRLYETTRAALEQQYQTDERFYSTILLFSAFADEPIYVINGSAGGTDRVRQDGDEILSTALALSETLDTSITYFAVGNRVFMLRNLVNSNYETIALLMMELNTDLLFTEFSQIPNLEMAVATVGDVTLNITSVELPEAADVAAQPLSITIDPDGTAGTTVTYQDGLMYSVVRVIQGDYTVAFYGITTPATLNEQWKMTLFMLAIVILLMLPLGALVFYFFAKHVAKPIQTIMSSASKLVEGELGVQLQAEAFQSRELGALGDNFNEVSKTLKRQFEHIYKEEIALRDARIMALQSQINPHFLNNTLEIINWEARMQGNLKVCNMIESLSLMLGAAMDRNSNRSVHLSQELMYVDAYLYIINERLGKRLVFEKSIPDEFLDVQVPRLVLQPILENAVEHGITPLQQGRISLSAVREGEWLYLCVENDGVMSEADREKVESLLHEEQGAKRVSGSSLGLRNVHQRLRILYGEEAGILVDTTKKGVTVFKLKVKFN